MSSKNGKESVDLLSLVYKVILEHGKEGILQSDLWKVLSLNSRDGSRLSLRLEKRGMVKRERVLSGGRWTYKLTPCRMPISLASIENAPCLTCKMEDQCALNSEVSPCTCTLIAEWVIGEWSKASSKNEEVLVS